MVDRINVQKKGGRSGVAAQRGETEADSAISSLPPRLSAVHQPFSFRMARLPVSKLPTAVRDGAKGLQRGGENDSHSAFIISNVST